ncbi:gamma-glutamyltranspeptidase [Hortaea werneckii]|nr:gamma-glutamyltranspeptidase [Hortaea werneckii]
MPLSPTSTFPNPKPPFAAFPSRRSTVHSTKAIVACTQPLAAQCGLEILRKGGNCADAAVAVAAGLNMTEPGSTGIGGDMFCLFYDAATKQVRSLNGSGRSGKNCTLQNVRRSLGVQEGEQGKIPLDSVHAVSVPGAAAGWVDTVERFGSGKVSMAEILAPAVELGERGFPVSECMGFYWNKAEASLKAASPNYAEMLKKDPSAPDGCRAPEAGEIMRNPTLANTFRLVGEKGKAGFYSGSVAEELIKVTSDLGGHLTLDDLKSHMEIGTEETEPISLRFKAHDSAAKHGKHMSDNSAEGVDIWEHPPNGQGIIALMALGIIEQLEKSSQIPQFTPEDHNSTAYLHAIIESLRIAFADGNWFIADPSVSSVPTSSLISPKYLSERAQLFNPNKANPPLTHGEPSPAHRSSDTVYFAVTDSAGNGISFINSNYAGFGTGIIPRNCGFTLQNRAANFVLQPPNHPNILRESKRPYHTIIPALVTNAADQSLHSVYGVMGGFMQPQGHIQVLLNQLLFNLSPQEALDAPRVCIGAGMPDEGDVMDMTVYLEEGIPENTVEGLRKLGHKVQVVKGWERGLFGRGQLIRWSVDGLEDGGKGMGVWSAGSDLRGDGAAVPL